MMQKHIVCGKKTHTDAQHLALGNISAVQRET